jgi:DNA (cytosine-5)-methyltransferase 1
MWSSDIDKYVIQSIKSNYEPEILFGDPDGPYPNGDMTQRDHSKLPNIDLYVAGFPCQPFSIAGQRKGFKDKRGNVFWSCLDVIETKKPKYFILENVKGILWNDKKSKKDKYGRTWNTILDALGGLKQYGYFIDWKVLNTKDYGIPQNRERVFIVGTRGKKKFMWPEPVKMGDLMDYIDWTDTGTREPPNYGKKLIASTPKNCIINLGFRQRKYKEGICPCIVCGTYLWNKMLSRFCNLNELSALQGFTCINFDNISKTQAIKQLGNSMSSNVIKAILKQIV